ASFRASVDSDTWPRPTMESTDNTNGSGDRTPEEIQYLYGGPLPTTHPSFDGEKILDAASDAEGVSHPRRHESHDGPGRLRRRTLPFPAPLRVAVRQARLTPPAIGILLRLKPGDCTENRGLREIHSDRT